MAVMPVIGVVACIRQVGLHPYHIAGDKYLQAILAVGGLPLILPALGHAVSSESLLAQVDGLLLTGSPSNIEPHHYSGPADSAQGCSDPARDHTTLPLIRAACAAGVPLLGICRGFQEINVALEPTQGFLLGVQWHLEWQMQSNPQSLAIFQAFAEACRMRQKQR